MSKPRSPNIDKLAEQLREVSEQMRHLASLVEAPVEKDKDTLDALDEIKVLLEQHRNELEEQLHRSRNAPHESDVKVEHQDTMEERAAKDLQAQLAQKAEEYNARACEQNRIITSSLKNNEPLVPLRSLETNEVIPGFPKTVREMALLQEPTARVIMQALGCSHACTLADVLDVISMLSGVALSLRYYPDPVHPNL